MKRKRDVTTIWSALRSMSAKKGRTAGRTHDGHGAAVEHPRCRRPHDVGLDDPAGGIDGQVHRQLAVELLALVLGEVARATLFDLAPQRVVVDRVLGLARGRADVALLRPGVLFIDALFDLGQVTQQLAPPLFLGAFVGRAGVACGVGRRQQRDLTANLCEQLLLLLLQLLDLAA